jgi:hypothetical protein
MALVRIGGNLANKVVVLALNPDTMPSTLSPYGTITSLGTFEHAFGQAEADDVIPGNKHGFNHTFMEHVWEVLRKRSFSNLSTTKTAMQWPDALVDLENWKVVGTGEYIKATGIYTKNPANLSSGTPTRTLVTKHLPTGVVIPVSELNFVSDNTAVATVSSIGVVTRVAAGVCRIRVTRKDAFLNSFKNEARVICV